jgi:hypothetical protein
MKLDWCRRRLVSGNLVHERFAGVQGVGQFDVALGVVNILRRFPGGILRIPGAVRARHVAGEALGAADHVAATAKLALCSSRR